LSFLKITSSRGARSLGAGDEARAVAADVPAMDNLNQLLEKLRSREEGQTMAEYGVVLTVITLGALSALTLLSGNIAGAMQRVAGFIS
jgi:Flp pilus assembly pilin Flp